MKGFVNSFESFGSVDGPGVRSVIFLQGCSMRCKYCHNPETWTSGGEEWEAEALFEKTMRYKSYWGKNGGVTVSGGEPMLQMRFVTELFGLFRERQIHTALDTSGQPFEESADFAKLMDVTDLVILDLKEIDEEKHIELTGKSNKNILKMARLLSETGKPMWIRHVLVPGVTDGKESLLRTAKSISSLKSVERVEVLPYHTLGVFKWEKLGLKYPLEGVRAPSEEEKASAERILRGEKAYYTYMLRCRDGSVYTGITTSVARRMEEHFSRGGKCAKYTLTHPAEKLEAAWESGSRSAASKLEYGIKRLAKEQKERLIEKNDFSPFAEKIRSEEYKRVK